MSLNSISITNQLPEKVKSAIGLVRPDGVLKTTVKNSRDEPYVATYSHFKVIGHGSFGAVFLVEQKIENIHDQETELSPPVSISVVAMKMVYQDKRYKNRELQIMKSISHPNIISFEYYFYKADDKNEQDIYLFLVLEYIPDTVFHLCQSLQNKRHVISIEDLKLITALEYLHSRQICHRDIKPQNLLVDLNTKTLKICDFGSAKMLIKGEPNVSYICSRYYRAPELLLSSTNYTYVVDLWSAGCVMAEFMLNTPIFPGTNDLDQMLQIIRVLGSPTLDEIEAMNPSQSNFTFPSIRQISWSKMLPSSFSNDPLIIDFLSSLLKYSPYERLTSTDALRHPFFDSIRHDLNNVPSISSISSPLQQRQEGDEDEGLQSLSKIDLNLKNLEFLNETRKMFSSFSNSATPLHGNSSTEGSNLPPININQDLDDPILK